MTRDNPFLFFNLVKINLNLKSQIYEKIQSPLHDKLGLIQWLFKALNRDCQIKERFFVGSQK